MSRHRPVWGSQILWFTVLPVLLVGLALGLAAEQLVAPPLAADLEERADADLELASHLGLQACDDAMDYLLELRLENQPEMVAAAQRETLAQIKEVGQWFPKINTAVVDADGNLVAGGDRLKWPTGNSSLLRWLGEKPRTVRLGQADVRISARFFPLWRWYVVAAIAESDYMAPGAKATNAIFLATFGMLLALVLILLVVFHVRVAAPLKSLVTATREVSAGRFPRLGMERRDELGELANAFDSMVESLQQGRRQVNHALASLRESEERYRLVTEYSLAWIMVVSEGRIIFANNRVTADTGYAHERLLSMQVTDLFHPEDRSVMARRAARRGDEDGGPAGFEVRVLTADGRVMWLEVLAASVNYQRQAAILLHAVDITARMAAEQEQETLRRRLEHSQKLEVIGTLAGGMAHDFNNLLQIIEGYVHLAQRELGPDQAALGYLEGIAQSVGRGGDVIRRLLAFGRQVDQLLEPVDLGKVLEQVTAILGHTLPREIGIELEVAQDLPLVQADPSQLEQVFLNLASNARDAMPQGGKLSFSAHAVELDKAATAGYPDLKPGRYVRASVADTGLGMDAETRERIFEPFFTTKELGRGTGLGLATVYGLVKSHGGHITCVSEPGLGTEFSVFLPAHAERLAQSAGEDRERHDQPLGGGERILLVDDEAHLLHIGREALSHYGYEVITAQSGEEAVETLRAGGEAVDLVILDLSMPGMGGRRALDELLALTPSLKVIIASGYAKDGQVSDSLEAGAAGFIAKPFRIVDLLNKVREILDDQGPRA